MAAESPQRSVASIQDIDASVEDTTPRFAVPRNLHARCTRHHRWDEAFTERAIRGYQQFMGLKIRLEDWDSTKLAAPPLIEQVWEQHILDVNHYAEACAPHRIHHTPDDAHTEGYEGRVRSTELALEHASSHDAEIWSFGKTAEEPRKRKRALRTGAITFFVRWAQNNNLHRHNDLYFKIRPDTKMARVFERFVEHWAVDDDSSEPFTFFFDGRVVRPTDTANTMGLVTDDMVSATRCNAVEDD